MVLKTTYLKQSLYLCTSPQEVLLVPALMQISPECRINHQGTVIVLEGICLAFK